MASHKLFIKDSRKRLLFKKFFMNRTLYKYLSQDIVLPFNLKRYVFLKLFFRLRNSTSIQIQNRCIYTYRSKSIHVKFKLSRIQLREYIWKSLIPGISIASW